MNSKIKRRRSDPDESGSPKRSFLNQEQAGQSDEVPDLKTSALIPQNNDRLTTSPAYISCVSAEPASTSSRQTDSLMSNIETMLPCLHPSNSDMQSKEARLQTFREHSTMWSAHRILASPQQMVDAGFYCLGDRDRVKCFYCNGGLQNWERNDSPWEEHAKWYPTCEYVFQQRGADYAQEIGSKYPNLTQATGANSAAASDDESSENDEESDRPVIVDPREELKKIDGKTALDMNSSELVKQAKLMGFTDSVLREVLKRQYTVEKSPFSSLESLVEASCKLAQNLQNNNQVCSQNENQLTSLLENFQHDIQAATSEDKKQSIRQLESLEISRRCKVCYEDKACIVFIPCGHLACCVKCGEKSKRCPICKEFVGETVCGYTTSTFPLNKRKTF